MSTAIQAWRRFEASLRQRGFGFGLHYAPPHLQQARTLDAPCGAALDHLLPEDYRRFVAEVGYPVVGFRYYDRSGMSFLPPSVMAVHSVMLPTPDGDTPPSSQTEPVRCAFAFFAGYDLSDVEGFAFGPGEAGENVVWLVEGGMPREECGPFTAWFVDELERIERELEGTDAAALQAECDGETDPHRLLDYALDGRYDLEPYAPEDAQLHWVESQAKTPYLYGLVDDDGNWRIPMGQRFLSVRPFRGGVAEVILNEAGSSYSGPWTTIRSDGSAA